MITSNTLPLTEVFSQWQHNCLTTLISLIKTHQLPLTRGLFTWTHDSEISLRSPEQDPPWSHKSHHTLHSTWNLLQFKIRNEDSYHISHLWKIFRKALQEHQIPAAVLHHNLQEILPNCHSPSNFKALWCFSTHKPRFLASHHIITPLKIFQEKISRKYLHSSLFLDPFSL